MVVGRGAEEVDVAAGGFSGLPGPVVQAEAKIGYRSSGSHPSPDIRQRTSSFSENSTIHVTER